jgi:hypothetical protein
LFVYDVGTQTITEDPDFVWRDSPQRDGNLTVLTRHDGTDREIFLRINGSRDYHQITHNNLEDTSPSISGDYITWMAGDEIFLADCRDFALAAPGGDEKSGALDTAKGAAMDSDRSEKDSSGGGRCFIDTAANSLGW